MKATTKNQVIDYLQWSTQDYEENLFLCIMKWCQKHGRYPSIMQQLLANPEINQWFMIEFAKCESQFISIAEIVSNKTTLEDHYHACVKSMQDIYPQPLIDCLKRNRDFSNVLVEHTPVIYAN